MLNAAFLAAALALGAPPGVVAVVAVALYQPVWFLVGAAGWAVAARIRAGERAGPDDEARFLQGVAAELDGGASLRGALVEAAGRASRLDLQPVVRRAALGRPMAEVAAALRASLPLNGRLAGPALGLAAATGGRSAAVFSGLAVRAAAQGDLARERRSLTAQARLSAAIVAGAPLVLAAALAVGGGSASLLGLGAGGVALAAIGLGLELAGVAVVWWMIRRAER